MDLILVRKTSRLNYFRYLYRTGYMNQSPFDLPFVDIRRVREFTFTPTLQSGTKHNRHLSSGKFRIADILGGLFLLAHYQDDTIGNYGNTTK